MVVTQAKLGLGAAHAERDDATLLGLLDLEVAGKHGADHGHGHIEAGAHVGGAADDLQRLGLAVLAHVLLPHVHGAHVHVVGVRVRHAVQHVARDHALQARAGVLDALYLGARTHELGHQLLRIGRQVHHLFQPLI